MNSATAILFRRTCANLIDTTLEISGGLLGSYFGMLVAALLASINEGPAQQMQHSMLSGFGFGLVVWTLSVSFLNRVLIQGLSRASIGKKIANLELISTEHALSWKTIFARWIMGLGSVALMGIGYWSAFFEKDGRTLHDLAARTDVVPIYKGRSLSVEYREAEVIPFPTHASHRRNAAVKITNTKTLAEVIEMSPRKKTEKEAA
jgi:uncharacterized RDD family membrane protein YckC